MEGAGGRIQEEGIALVLDSNVLFMIVVAGSRSRAYRIIEEHELNLFTPEEALIEFHRHVEKLRRHAIKDFETKVYVSIHASTRGSEGALRR